MNNFYGTQLERVRALKTKGLDHEQIRARMAISNNALQRRLATIRKEQDGQ